MPSFAFRYVAYAYLDELDDRGEDRESAKADLAAELLSYTATIDPTLVSVTEVPFRGTELEEWSDDVDRITDTCIRVEWTGTVQAEYSDPNAQGDNDHYRNSAQGIVDENSWNGGEHGWGAGGISVLCAVATESDVEAPALV